MAIGPSGTTRRSYSARLARLAAHAVLDPADRALVHTIIFGKGPHPLAPRQGRLDLTDLSIQNLRTRMVISPQMPSVPQAVSRIAGVIAQVKIARPIVSRIIIAVADELIAAELPTQDNGHYRAVQHYLPLLCHSCRAAANDPPGQNVRPPVSVVPKLAKPPRTTEAEITREFQARNSGNLIPAILKPFPEHDGSPLDELFPVEICSARRGYDCRPGGSARTNLHLLTVLPEFGVRQLGPEGRQPRSERVRYSASAVASRAGPSGIVRWYHEGNGRHIRRGAGGRLMIAPARSQDRATRRRASWTQPRWRNSSRV